MGLLWRSGRFLLFDLAASLFFVALYAVTKNLLLSVAVGAAIGVAQIGWELFRRRPVQALQWLSLILVIASGAGAYIAHDPRIVLIKPSVVYVLVGATMLKRGWMTRYMPEEARTWTPDLAERWGYVWAGLMFVSAALNLVLAFRLSLVQWGEVMGLWATGSKIALFAVQFTTMRAIGHKRHLAAEAAASTGSAALA